MGRNPRMTPKDEWLECVREFTVAAQKLTRTWDKAIADHGADLGTEDYPFGEDFAEIALRVTTWNETQRRLALKG